jgi:hypothetical protein
MNIRCESPTSILLGEEIYVYTILKSQQTHQQMDDKSNFEGKITDAPAGGVLLEWNSSLRGQDVQVLLEQPRFVLQYSIKRGGSSTMM